MSTVHNVANRKNMKKNNRRAPQSAVEKAKTTAEPKALYKVNAAAQKRSTIAERLEESEALTCKMLGLEDPELAQALIKQVKQLEAAMAFGGGAEVSGIAMPMLFEMKPTNLTQALLAVQMSGVHHAALLYMKRAALVAKANLNSKTPDTNMMMAMRLMSRNPGHRRDSFSQAPKSPRTARSWRNQECGFSLLFPGLSNYAPVLPDFLVPRYVYTSMLDALRGNLIVIVMLYSPVSNKTEHRLDVLNDADCAGTRLRL
jgi:hypothetical protein